MHYLKLNIWRTLSTANIKGIEKTVMYSGVLFSYESEVLVYYLLVLAFAAIMEFIEECVIQPNIVQFAFRIV